MRCYGVVNRFSKELWGYICHDLLPVEIACFFRYISEGIDFTLTNTDNRCKSSFKEFYMKRFSVGLLSMALTLGAALSAQANAIPGLFNTGVDGAGVSLPDATIGDPHYILLSVPGGTTDLRVRTSAGGFPIPPYIGDSPTSAWVGPNNDSAVDGPGGTYDYQTSFDLTGYLAGTASISGGWSSDNDGLKILINGVDSGNASTSFTQFASGYASFTISSGFVPGINTIDFLVNNGGGPTALRVEMGGTANPNSQVPEPGSIALLSGLGVAGTFLIRRRRA